MTGKPRDGSAYGIRLFDRELPGADYDEWDCIDDIEAEKLIELKGTGINPCFTMTDKGHEMITKLLKHKSTGGNFSDFKR